MENTFLYLSILACVVAGCGNDGSPPLQMNEIQVLGTHNSYHIQPRDEILGLVAALVGQETADGLEYTALPLQEQFDRGVRQIELDVFADPEGGLYAERRALPLIGIDEVSPPELYEPGLKVLHVQDLDFETTA